MLYLGDAQVNIRIGENGKDNEGGNSTSSGTVVDVSKFYVPKEYEIYLLVDDTPYKLDYSLRNIDNCKIRTDETCDSNYLILDGKLFQIIDAKLGMAGLAQVGTSDKWTDVTGTSTTGTYEKGRYVAFGICDGALYKVHQTTPTLVDDTMKWTQLSGHVYVVKYSSSSYTSIYALGIGDGYIHRINVNNLFNPIIHKYKSLKDYYFISGMMDDVRSSTGWDRYALAYNGTNLKSVEINSIVDNGTQSGLTKITYCGTAYSTSPGNYYSYALNANGDLYRIQRLGIGKTSIFKKPCQDVSGYSRCYDYSTKYNTWPLVINDNKLYYLEWNTAYQIGADTDWTNVYGHFTSTRRAYAIRSNKLYSIKNKTVLLDTGLKNPVKVQSNNNGTTNPSLVICRA